jgi:endonuclease/exonuclease/phosphatase family metal-dependent hydrolase
MAMFVCPPTRAVRLVRRLAIALMTMCSVATAASAQTTVTLSAPGSQINADLTIQGGSAGYTDFSNDDTLASKVASASYTRRILLKIDTQNNIPANAVIQSAKLYLVLSRAESSQARPFTAYYVAQSFAAGQTNWYNYRSGQAWQSPGGDFGDSFGTTYVGNNLGQAYAFDLTNLVQRTVNGEFGSRYTRVALVDTGGADSGNYREFYSTRAINGAVRPKLVVTYGGSSTSSASSSSSSSSSSGTTLRVMQWNIHKTMGSDGACNPDRTASAIVAQNPDVVSINEVNFYSGTCAFSFDMADRLETLLQEKTGVQWYRQSVNPNGVGNALLSRIAPVSSSSFILDNGRGVAQMGIPVNGRTVNVFSTHIEYDNASWRPAQIAEALGWLNNFSQPRIFMGDFNTWSGTGDYYTLTGSYTDSWVAASNAGTASSYNGTGATEGESRIDYVFIAGSQLSISSVKVPDTTVNGVRPSDHDPIVAKFTVR